MVNRKNAIAFYIDKFVELMLNVSFVGGWVFVYVFIKNLINCRLAYMKVLFVYLFYFGTLKNSIIQMILNINSCYF